MHGRRRAEAPAVVDGEREPIGKTRHPSEVGKVGDLGGRRFQADTKDMAGATGRR